jgi:hypothetical protein
MLEIKNYKKIEGLVLNGTLTVRDIYETSDTYWIWLSNSVNIQIDREPAKRFERLSYYTVHYNPPRYNGVEYVTNRMINTLAVMRMFIIYLDQKYK